MSESRFFIGPMSKNIVDAIIEWSNKTGNKIGLIPSRRQVEYDGGYVNNWTTDEFSYYVKSKSKNIILQRDHAGPDQGKILDEGIHSAKIDCWNFDLMHVDPWKRFPKYAEGLKATAELIEYCYKINPHLEFEVGTEEAIRRFEVDELEDFLEDLRFYLKEDLFQKIKYLVVQSGTSLKGTEQTGKFNPDRLINMVILCKKYGLLSKEHNGDYLSDELIKEKFSLGLDAINIAPEFGLIETETYLHFIKNVKIFRADHHLFNNFFEICYASKKWEKWVNKDFKPFDQKEELIKICGHYVLSDPLFIGQIKVHFPDIDDVVKEQVKIKLNRLWKILDQKQ